MPERVGRYSEAVRWIRRGLRHGRGVGRGSRAPAGPAADLVRRRAPGPGRSREAVHWCELAIELRRAASATVAPRPTPCSSWTGPGLAGATELADPRRGRHWPSTRSSATWAGQAVVLNNLGAFEYFRGDWDEAASLYARGRDARLATGNDVDAAIGTINIGEILADQGRYEEGRTQLDRGAPGLRAASYRYGIAYATMLLGRLESRTGRSPRPTSTSTRPGPSSPTSASTSTPPRWIPWWRSASSWRAGAARHWSWPPAWSRPWRSRAHPGGWPSCSGSAATPSCRRGMLEAHGPPSRPAGTAPLELNADYELALTLVALGRLADRTGDPDRREELQDRVGDLSAQLGIVAFPEVPVGGVDVSGWPPTGEPGPASARRGAGTSLGSAQSHTGADHGPTEGDRMATIEELARELAELRRRVDASESVLELQALKARYGELVDQRYSAGGVVGERRARRGSPTRSPSCSPSTGCGTAGRGWAGHRSSGHRRPAPRSDPHLLASPVREAEDRGGAVTGRRPGGTSCARAGPATGGPTGCAGTRTTSTSGPTACGCTGR